MVLRTIVAAAAMSAIAAVAQAATFNVSFSFDGKVIEGNAAVADTTVVVTGFVETSSDTGSFGVDGLSDWYLKISDGTTTQESRKGVADYIPLSGSFSIDGDNLLSTGFIFGSHGMVGDLVETTALQFKDNKMVAFATNKQPGVQASTAGIRGFSGPLASPTLVGQQLRLGQLQVIDAPPVPLPATGLLLLAGLGLYGGLRRKA